MIKKLLFKDGLSTLPSDYASDELSLAYSLNAVNDGELRSYPPFTEITTLPDGIKILSIHKINNTSFYICSQDNTLSAFHILDDGDIKFLDVEIDSSSFGEFYSAHIIGKTIALLYSSGIHYILYKDSTYKYLGTKPPRLDITFGLKGRLARSEEFAVTHTVDFAPEDKDRAEIPEEDRKAVTATLLAQANKFMTQKGTEKGLFAFPFFVRYAYKLYDGTHTMHSAPVLMLPSTYQAIKALIYSEPSLGGEDISNPSIKYENPKARIVAFLDKLIIKNVIVDYEALSSWEDIVEGVDIFVSAPIYNYDQNGEVKDIVKFSSSTSIDSVEELDYGIYEPYASRLHSGKHYFYDAYLEARTYGAFPDEEMPSDEESLPETGEDYIPKHMYLLPRKKTKIIFDDIKDTSLFYLLYSLKNKENRLQGDLSVSKDILPTLQLQPTLEEDYGSNDLISSNIGYVYNSRLNIAGITRRLFSGYKAECLSSFTQPFGSRPIYDIYTYINDIGGEKIVKSTSSLPISLLGGFLYYPNTKAYKMVVVRRVETPSSEGVSYFDTDAYLMVHEDKDTGEKVWGITLNTSPDILSESDFIISGAIEFVGGLGGGAYEATLLSGTSSNHIPLGITYKEGDEVQFASFSITATNPSYKPYKVSFDYISGHSEYINDYTSDVPTPVSEWMEIKLEEHPSLNGAYYFSSFKDYTWKTEGLPSIKESDTPSVFIHNKIYTSEVENPFSFPVEGINTIGDGEIIGLASATQALSQGQFGDFPLYAFTSEGIWALSVNDKGTYYSSRSLSRDVCTHTSSITQTDTGVMFISSKGLMYLYGSRTSCLSEKLSFSHFDVTKLPYIDEFVSSVMGITIPLDTTPFLAYLKEANIIYDYLNSHAIIYNKNYTYSYIYSFIYKTWGYIEGRIDYAVNSYPSPQFVCREKLMTTGDKYAEIDLSSGLIITRPFSLNSDFYKTITQLYVRGSIPLSKDGNINMVLYGSRDGINYCVVNSGMDYIRQSYGTGYKYFVLCLGFNLIPSNAISCIDIDYREKQNNRLR